MNAPAVLRRATPADAADCVRLRGLTRENAIPADVLAALGITVESWAAGIASGAWPGWIATHGDRIAGYCFGDTASGEVLVLVVMPDFEGQGLGRALLERTVQDLQAAGHSRVHLGCSADPAVRSHGFYRRLGWQSTGRFDPRGDELLERTLPPR